MFLFLVELILGAAAVWYGRRWLVARLEETFGDNPENFDTNEDRRGWPGFIAFLAFFGVIALAAYWKLSIVVGLFLMVAVLALVWTIGNLPNWRRLEQGNPLRAALDPILASEGIRPSLVRLWRNPALLPTFTVDGRIEIPSAFVRQFSSEEQKFLYLALAEEATVRFRRRRVLQSLLIICGLGGFAFICRHFFHSFGFLGGMFGPMFSAFFQGGNAERRLTLDRLKVALERTGDFAAAERAIYLSLPEKTADERVTALREWWAMQSPANPTVAAMRSASVSATQRVGLGP